MGLIVNQHDPWDPGSGDRTEWISADDGWRLVDTSDGVVSLTHVLSPREDCHVQITTNGLLTVDEVISRLQEPSTGSDGVVASVDGELFGGFVGVGWIPLDDELSWERAAAVPSGRPLAGFSVSGGGFTSGTMQWTLAEVRPGLLCDSYHDDHGHGFSCQFFDVDPGDYASEAVSLVEGAAHDDVSNIAVARALAEGGGSWDVESWGRTTGTRTPSTSPTNSWTGCPFHRRRCPGATGSPTDCSEACTPERRARSMQGRSSLLCWAWV